MSKRCIIVGASHAAAQLVASLRQQGWEDEILLIGDEPHLPYHRPPLSKTFLAGDKSAGDLSIRPAAFYDKHNVEFRHAQVSSINRAQKTISLSAAEVISYDKLALCTGARVRKISLPGIELSGVHYLRNISDVEGIKAELDSAQNIVIIGGGYIGLETAAAMKEIGLNVTVLEAAPRILQRVTAPELSDFYSRVHAEEGVEIHTSVAVSRLEGQGQVEKVLSANGQEFKADLVVIGVGVLPNVELAQEAGIKVNNGIELDLNCRTNDEHIVAAGDCSNHFNKIYARRLRLESVPNATDQAKVAAATICGVRKEQNSLPWFWSDQYQLKLQIAGLSQGYDQVLIRGDHLSGRSFAAFYFNNGQLIAADCVNRPKEFMLSKKIISQSLEIDYERLIDESIEVKDLL